MGKGKICSVGILILTLVLSLTSFAKTVQRKAVITE